MKSLTRLPNTSGDLLPPHLLRLGTLLTSHSAEIGLLLGDAPSRKCQINKCLRRRLRSYRPFTTLHSKRERFRRSRRNLNLIHDTKGDLPTHVWHAKRMKMGKLWNVILPLNVNDKGQRAIFKRATKSCVIHDMSYWHCFSVPIDELPQPFKLKCFDNSQFIAGKCRVVDMLRDTTGNVLSPIYLFCPPSQPGTALIWLHPCLPTPVSLVPFRTLDICWFELRGPLSSGIAGVFHQCSPGTAVSADNESTVIVTSQGCDIITSSREIARTIWKKLVVSGASAIGVNDRRNLLDEWQVTQFPFDAGNRNVLRMIATGRGIPRAGETIVDAEGVAIGVCVKGGFSYRLGRGAGLVEITKCSRVFYSGHEGRLEPLEWSWTDAPNFAPLLVN